MRIERTGGEFPQSSGPTTHVAQEGETLQSIANFHSVSTDSLARANFLSTDSQISAGQELIIPFADSNLVQSAEQLASYVVPAFGESDTLEVGGAATLTNFSTDFSPESFGAMKLTPAESDFENLAAMKLTPQETDFESLAAMKLTPQNDFESLAAMKLTPAESEGESVSAMKLMPQENNFESVSAMKLMPQENDFEGLAVMKLMPNSYSTQEGDTLESIAQRFNLQPDALAAANNLEPGVAIPSGTELIIPQE